MRSGFVVSGDYAYFCAASRADRLELWRTDATPAGTQKVADAGPASYVELLAPLGKGVVFFTMVNGRHVMRSWDGRGTGTVLVDLGPIDDRSMGRLVAHGSVAYFFVDHHWAGSVLWRTDGTAEGTQPAVEFPGPARAAVFAGPYLYVALAGANFAAEGELWRTDGTPAGTVSLQRMSRGVFAVLGDKLLLDSAHALWCIQEGHEPFMVSPVDPNELATAGNAVWIAASTSILRTDGTVAGTTTVFTQPSDIPGTYPTRLIPTGDDLYFGAYPDYLFHDSSERTTTVFGPFGGAAVLGASLYVTQSLGFYVCDPPPASKQWIERRVEAYRPFVPFRNRMLFAASDGVHGLEPTATDGSSTGTYMLANVYPEGSIHGSVLDAATGHPLTHPFVRLSPRNGWSSVEISVDPAGNFSIEGLPDGEYWINAGSRGPDYVSRSWPEYIVITAGTRVGGIDFLLQAGSAISGRVTDREGRPVAGQDLWISSATSGIRVTTGLDGTYRTWSPLPPDRVWTVRLLENRGYSSMLYSDLLCYAGCLDADSTRVRTRAGETTDGVNLVARAYGRIRGSILDSVTGEPILAIGTVQAAATTPSPFMYVPVSTSGRARAGRYEVAIPDRGAIVTVTFDLGKSAYRDGTYPSAVIIHPDTTADGYDIRVDPIGARIRGHVLDRATAQPIPGVPVYVVDANGLQVAAAVAGADGAWGIPPVLLPGSYRVRTPGKRGWNGGAWNAPDTLPCNDCPADTGAQITVTGTEVVTGVEIGLVRRD